MSAQFAANPATTCPRCGFDPNSNGHAANCAA